MCVYSRIEGHIEYDRTRDKGSAFVIRCSVLAFLSDPCRRGPVEEQLQEGVEEGSSARRAPKSLRASLVAIVLLLSAFMSSFPEVTATGVLWLNCVPPNPYAKPSPPASQNVTIFGGGDFTEAMIVK